MLIGKEKSTRMSNLGRLYAFEGIDGAGKTTLIKHVAMELEKRGEKVVIQSYPSHRLVGKLVREASLTPLAIATPAYLHLFIADALDNEAQIVKWVDDGYTVLTDRNPIISPMMYQVEVFPLEYVFSVCRPSMFTPVNIVFVVDVPATIAFERTQKRGTPLNIYDAESINRAEVRRARYNSLWSFMCNVVYLDGTRVATDNVKAVIAATQKLNEIILSKN